MIARLPKLFRRPIILHDLVSYHCGPIPEKKLQNWIRMNRSRLDTESYRVPAYPYILQVEPTNRCNLACSSCPCGRGELNRPPQDLDLALFNALLEDMGDYLLFLILWDWGEPFMHPGLPEIIRAASARGIHTVTSTNCHFLHNEDYVAEILQAGLSSLIVAVDSISEEHYADYRQNGSVSQVISGVEKLVAIKKRLKAKTLINLRMVALRQNENDVNATREFARTLGTDLFTIKTANPSYGSKYLDADLVPENPALRRYAYKPGGFDRIPQERTCRKVWTMANILSNGSVVPCCRDFDARLSPGNINQTPFSELWNGESFRSLRRQVYREKANIEKCRHCDESFRLSPTGWFAEITDFTVEGASPTRQRLQSRLMSPRARMLLNQIHKRL